MCVCVCVCVCVRACVRACVCVCVARGGAGSRACVTSEILTQQQCGNAETVPTKQTLGGRPF